MMIYLNSTNVGHTYIFFIYFIIIKTQEHKSLFCISADSLWQIPRFIGIKRYKHFKTHDKFCQLFRKVVLIQFLPVTMIISLYLHQYQILLFYHFFFTLDRQTVVCYFNCIPLIIHVYDICYTFICYLYFSFSELPINVFPPFIH